MIEQFLVRWTQKVDIAVCDDNLSDREIIRQQLSIYFSDRFIEYNIDSYENGVNLIYSIEDGEYYDIIFLDMYMDKLNGIQVAEKLRNMNYKGKIIFLTVTSKYAVESYDVEASGYLVKPHDIDKISMVLDRVLSNYENVHTYQIKKRNSVIQVLYSEIEYIESSNSKCILHRTDGNEYTIYKKLNDIEEEINHRAFLRCHQSYLVNMNKIESVENDFTMKSGDVVPIRTRNLNEIKKEYYNFSIRNERIKSMEALFVGLGVALLLSLVATVFYLVEIARNKNAEYLKGQIEISRLDNEILELQKEERKAMLANSQVVNISEDSVIINSVTPQKDFEEELHALDATKKGYYDAILTYALKYPKVEASVRKYYQTISYGPRKTICRIQIKGGDVIVKVSLGKLKIKKGMEPLKLKTIKIVVKDDASLEEAKKQIELGYYKQSGAMTVGVKEGVAA